MQHYFSHYSFLYVGFKNVKVPTWYRQAVHLHAEVILQEKEADDGEEVNEKQGQNGCQNDGAPVPCHALDDIEQGLLPDHQVKQLSTATPSDRFLKQVCFSRDTTE